MLNKITGSGFTLAEVLLTLTIIGIIAAMTIPALMNSTNKIENVVALKKAYSTLMQANLMIIAENGGDITSALSGATTPNDFANVFIPMLNVVKNCGTNNDTCECPTGYKYMNGAPWGSLSTGGYSTILTNDGMTYAFYLRSANCTNNYSSSSIAPLNNTCGIIYVDINGPNKGPSMQGRDLFYFVATKTGIYPAGAYADINPGNCSTNGTYCTSKVLMESAMNY
ncbi:MAG: type II secretion system protein [Candidatus Gastranaerophilaceae bacterium]